MTREHEPEVDAAAYVSGGMRARERRQFERHLLSCETCWREVRLDREGRRLAEQGREAAPASLRDAVRASVAAGPPMRDSGPAIAIAAAAIGRRSGRPPHRRWAVLAVAAALGLSVVAGSFALHGRSEPAPIAAALDAYHRSAVTGSDHHMMPPDLTPLGLRSVAAAPMSLAAMPVEGFAYESADGGQLILYMAHSSFPAAKEATFGTGGQWRAERDGMTMLSGIKPVAYLVVSSDPSLVGRFQGALANGGVTIA